MKQTHPLATPPDPAQAAAWQQACVPLVVIEPGKVDAELVAAVDVAYAKDDSRAYAAAVVVERKTMRQVEHQVWAGPPLHGYEPGLFSLREADCVIPALEKLSIRPDVLVVDGHGIAHPRGFGLACHLGVLFDLPAVGCAKQPLVGKLSMLGPERGDRAALTVDDRTIGLALRTRREVKPVYVSPGHRFDLDSAAALILALAPRYRIPEPLRQAHHLSISLRMQDMTRL